MLNISRIAVVALAAGMIAGPVQASTVWHFPYKGAPFAMSHAGPRSESPKPKRRGNKRRDRVSTTSGQLTIASHKPPYHP